MQPARNTRRELPVEVADVLTLLATAAGEADRRLGGAIGGRQVIPGVRVPDPVGGR